MATPFDPAGHLLLRDQAHKRRIHTGAKFAEYVHRVREAGFHPRKHLFQGWPPRTIDL